MSRTDHSEPVVKRRKVSHNSANGTNSKPGPRPRERATESTDTRGDSSKRLKVHNDTKISLWSVTRAVTPGAGLTVQVGELLASVAPDYEARKSTITQINEEISVVALSVVQQGPFTSSEAEARLRKVSKVAIPWPHPKPAKESNLKYEFLPPTSTMVTGASFGIRGDADFTLVADIPPALLQEKDYLNLRIFHKRAFYLACLAAGMRGKLGSSYSFEYGYRDGLELLPVAILTESTKQGGGPRGSGLRLIIDVGLPADAVPLAKTTITRNCVRLHAAPDAKSPPPTPFYNSCLRRAASHTVYDSLLSQAEKACPSFMDAVRLGQVWLTQRAFGSDVADGGFGWWEWATMCALLLQTGGHRDQALFSTRYSNLQLFKAMLQVLATRDMKEPWQLRGSKEEIPPSDSPILYDGETGVNLLFKMTAASYQILKSYAQLSLKATNSKQDDSYANVFIAEVAQPVLQFDGIYSVKIDVPPYAAFDQKAFWNKLHKVLIRGLGDRATQVFILSPQSPHWSLSDISPSKSTERLQIMLSLDPDNVDRLVDHGPSAEDQAAATEFQRFWGPKSELRRFKDGTITESLLWASNEPVVSQIIKYLLQRHFATEPQEIRLQTVELDKAILPHSELGAKDAFALVSQKHQSLSSMLLSLADLPLPIRSVSAASPALRSTSLANAVEPSGAEPVSVLIQFDSSGRWPDSLPAIQHTKIAFLTKLGDTIVAADNSLDARIGLENTSSSSSGHLNTSFLDVTYPPSAPGLSPIVFRLRIQHERELHLLNSFLADRSVSGAVRSSLGQALFIYKREMIASTAHTTAMQSLMTRFPALSSATRLLQKWASSHLLSQHIPREALELIAAHIFLQPLPWDTPSSPTTAFLRCLDFITRWDWSTTPLIIDMSLSQDMTKDQRADLSTRFEAWRKLDPQMNQVTWFIGSNIDETGVVWTGNASIEKVVAGRVTQLASACMDVVRAARGQLSEDTGRSLFVSPTDGFDFLIHLQKSVVRGATSRKERTKGKYRNLDVALESDAMNVGFYPVIDFLKDLETTFGNVALFFYNDGVDGGRTIAGLWRPQVKGIREWRVRLGWSTLPLPAQKDSDGGEGKDMSRFNTAGTLKEMEVMGEGLVRSVELRG
jgi:U3 small nucleolar RNA-associated protein 22